MQSDGVTTRKHLESIARQTGVAPAMLIANQIPLEIKYLWDWFGELSNKRRTGGMSVSMLAWSDVDAWARLMRRDPQPWEVEALMNLDNIWFNNVMSKQK